MALKPSQLAFEKSLLEERLRYVKRLKEDLEQEGGTTSQMVAAYTSIIDEIISDVALEVHRAVQTGVDDLADVQHRLANGGGSQPPAVPPLPPPVAKGSMIDVFGNVVPPIALDQVACPSCGRKVAAGRFAPHLEKCMGRGRQASRNANKRISAMQD
ncbi:SAGA-associated factor 11 [Chlorella sorokiniana]|jgi:SAGA-associated factor 11|uniref:SAGA-associated factor 11 n=1 Tax=Chlorella sorokiniana TaxID=3076 RepID=A0A2P6TRN2_CHLSO|nr:SAGA-associated factor 11 [Chlorella sorokiniana]|eukprot:PRW56727.1 SAGA-associated factor 11 [Chlorella sorokiniana]